MNTHNIKIVPAVLTDKPETLATLMRQAETFTDYVQVDIMDGKFVPSHSITADQLAEVKTRLNYEVHLMIENPEQALESFKKAGAKKAIFHYESTSTQQRVIALARKLGLEVGMALNPETPVSIIKPLISSLDSILFLSVHPGFYGAKYIPEVLDKVVELRRSSPGLEIGIDGGIKESNVQQIAASGVDVIYAGSAIFLQPQPGEAYRKLVSLANQTSKSL